MSMIGEYCRLTPDGLYHAIEDPEWALDFVETLGDEIYPVPWEGEEAAMWGEDYNPRLTAYFRSAAEASDAMLLWLD
jgi:hypothetical protein